MASIRRAKWAPPPPPTPRILHLPRPTSRRSTKHTPTKKHPTCYATRRGGPQGKLETLFDQERAFSYNASPPAPRTPPVVLLNSMRRDRVELDDDDVEEREEGGGEVEERENDWRFQAEMLRAECNLLRMEKQVAVTALDNERGSFQRSLKSALLTLLSGKKKIEEGENVNSVLEEEIEELEKKLAELQRSSRVKSSAELNHSCSNFDKQASLLQKHLEKYNDITNSDEGCVKDIPEISGASLSIDCRRDRRIKLYSSTRRCNKFTDVESLRRKMEGLSKGKLLKRMEEVYGSMLSTSVPSSASTSRRYDLTDLSTFLSQQSSQVQSGELKTCSGHCKSIVRRIMEQVKAETEQWSQMQEMLGQVKDEMEELQASRDFWEERALKSDRNFQTLQSEVEDWKQKVLTYEIKEGKLHKQVQELQRELEKLKARESHNSKSTSSKSSPITLGAQLAMEKRALTCRVKENGHEEEEKTVNRSDSSRLLSFNRHPFKDIGNLSPLVRQNSRKYVYPLHSPKEALG